MADYATFYAGSAHAKAGRYARSLVGKENHRFPPSARASPADDADFAFESHNPLLSGSPMTAAVPLVIRCQSDSLPFRSEIDLRQRRSTR